MRCSKKRVPGVAIICLGSGIFIAAFFSPWCIVAIESAVIVVGGVALLCGR